MESKKKINIGWIISGVFLLVLLISASFAYFGMFTVNLENKMAVNIHASTIGNTSFIATSANLNVIVPTSGMFKGNTGLAAENTATLTVNLTGASDVITTCTYDVVYEYDLDSEIYGSTVAVTSGATKEITLEVSSPSGTNSFANETNFAYDSSWTSKTSTVGAKKTLVKNAVIVSEGTSVVQDINITGRYYNLDVEQAQLGNKSFTGTIYVENNNCTVKEPPKANEVILLNNGGIDAINAKGIPTFTNSATTNEGMYMAEDDYGTSYYFRGAIDNNWVKFGEVDSKPIYWRIIRINGDGSIRLLYTGTTALTEEQKVIMTGEGTQIGSSAFNNYNSKSPEYVGYKYEIGKQHGLANDSTAKVFIENWYKTTTLYIDEAISKLVVDLPFCYDRTASTSATGIYGEISSWASTWEYYYGSYGRTWGNNKSWNPSLKCANELDKYSVANGTLSYPVGLITADEIVLAGGNNNNNNLYYLYTGQEYLSASPYRYNDDRFPQTFSVSSSGNISYIYFINNSSGVRPVINLSSEAKLSGNGTWNNPYTVNLS